MSPPGRGFCLPLVFRPASLAYAGNGQVADVARNNNINIDHTQQQCSLPRCSHGETQSLLINVGFFTPAWWAGPGGGGARKDRNLPALRSNVANLQTRPQQQPSSQVQASPSHHHPSTHINPRST